MKLRYYLRGLGIGVIVTALLMGVAGNRKQNMTDEEVKARAAELGMIEGSVLAEPDSTKAPDTLGEGAEDSDGGDLPASTAGAAATPAEDAEISVTPETGTAPTLPADREASAKPETGTTPTLPADGEASAKPAGETMPTLPAGGETSATPAEGASVTPTGEQPSPTDVGNDQQDFPSGTVTAVPEQAETVIITIFGGESSVSVSRSVAAAGLAEDASDFDRYLCANGYDKKLAVGSHEIPVGASYREIAEELTRRR